MNSKNEFVACKSCYRVYGKLQIEFAKLVLIGTREDNQQHACIGCSHGVKLKPMEWDKKDEENNE